jgi:hypothetical protein
MVSAGKYYSRYDLMRKIWIINSCIFVEIFDENSTHQVNA